MSEGPHPTRDPFAVLGITPTLEPARVKKGYFEAIARHSPHADPDAFRTVRAAYEALMAPGALPAAYLTAPIDVSACLEACRQRFGEQFDRAAQTAAREREIRERSAAFVRTACDATWKDAIARFGE